MSDTPWGGRFDTPPNELAARFTESVHVDRRLAMEDVRGSRAHAAMLAAAGILSAEDADRIASGLAEIEKEIADGRMEWDPSKEDVHMNIEARLTSRIGDAGARLHTARSRNDQVATDLRLFVREACKRTMARIDRLLSVLLVRAEGTVDVLLPGYTHLQRAQPIRLSHHLLAWCEMFDRDRGRLSDAANRLNESPLGAGALATTTFPIDRAQTAQALGFRAPTRNSLDAVADRDFLIEVVSALATTAIHLSRVGEEIVLWSTQEFGFCQMSDAFTTGSSMMPQKKNPDVAELVRGKSARVTGSLVSLLMLQKGLPLAYNRDLQEDKEPVFDAFDTVDACLDVMAAGLATTRFFATRMRAALREGFVEATEIADYLAAKGVPFRQAHHVAGRLVRQAQTRDKTLSGLSLEEMRAEHPAFEEDVFRALDPETMIERRDVIGGPAKAHVRAALAELRTRLGARGVDPGAVASTLSTLDGAGG